MELSFAQLYTLEVIELNGTTTTVVTKTGGELLADYSFLQVGQVVVGYTMYVVTPFGL